LADRVRYDDPRPASDVVDEYLGLLEETIALRFRSDVPVGINLSGGLDSSILLGLVHDLQGPNSHVEAFTFVTGDERYDELPWVERMLRETQHPHVVCRLDPAAVPALAQSVHHHQSEPYGGLPTLAYARLFEEARERGVTVLLDGQGMDEQWAGYDYYRSAESGAAVVQGTSDSPVKPACLRRDFAGRALVSPTDETADRDRLRALQRRDICSTKLPRALRYNDGVSMRASVELREPFLDHRLVELALAQPSDRKVDEHGGKMLLRRLAADRWPAEIVEAPKRPLQTPQREWLAGPLRNWASGMIEDAIGKFGETWLDPAAVRREWRTFLDGGSDNSFYVWQWISLGLLASNQGA
jgi:asparagine synthase (glutamine-hydrolysing)